jgi:protocatechuate 4,5-dioxygenase beta chain
MAEIVAAMAMTHAPGLTGWFTRAPESDQRRALEATAEMRRRLLAARPDVLVMFSNDHLLNWPINNMPEYTVGIAEEHTGPADWFDEWLGMEKYRVPGHAPLARYLVNEGARRGLGLAHLREMQFDDGISVPTHFLNPDARVRLVPVTMNCTVPPIPTPERAYQVGSVLREVLRSFPAADRIAVVATGGLSHEPGGPRYFWVDEAFDLWFLELLRKGDHQALLRECTLDRMEEAGSGGTAELLAWILVLASRVALPTCWRTCPPSPGAPAPAWWPGATWRRRLAVSWRRDQAAEVTRAG